MMWQDVIQGERSWSIEQADCVGFLRSLPADSVDLVIGSPPYMDARTYGIGAVYTCREWVDWMLAVSEAAVRVSKGLVLWVAAGVQRDSVYWPGCEGLMWEWWKRGNHLWCPAVWWKVDENDGGTGIPGSGGSVPGRRWLRKDWEYVMCFKKPGLIPYDMPTAMGHAPVVAEVGGQMSNRTADGRRINDAGARAGVDRKERWNAEGPNRRRNGKRKAVARDTVTMEAPAGTNGDGTRKENTLRPMPKIANPGNCIIVKARVGGGHMGSALCHENEAPYPEELVRFFVKSYAPPNGIVCDCFSGSGTTAAVSITEGRRFVGCDLRHSQVDLGGRRVAEVTQTMFPE